MIPVLIATGCEKQNNAPSTEEDRKSFMGDASKMPADVKAKMNAANQGKPAGAP